jgi:hypothetical protein
MRPKRIAAAGLIMLALSAVATIGLLRQTDWPLHPGELDLRALPAPYWIALGLGTAGGLLALWNATGVRTCSWVVVGLAFLYGPAFLLGLWPAFAGWDTFLHAAPASSLLQGAGLPPTNFYAGQYPGPPLLLATVSAVSGLSPMDAGLIVVSGAAVSLSLVWMGLARTFLGDKIAAAVALAVLATTPAVLTNEHFSPWFVGYLATWGVLLLLALAITRPDRSWTALSVGALLLGAAVVISHPFLPIVILGLLVGAFIWSWWVRTDKTRAIGWFTGVLLVGFISWMLYVATIYLATSVSFLRDLLVQSQDVSEPWAALPISEVFRRADPPALALMVLRIGLYVATGALALAGLLLPDLRRRVVIVLGLAATTMSSVVVGFSSDSSWLLRVLYMAPPLLTLGAGMTLVASATRFHLGRRAAGVGLVGLGLALLASLFLWHPPTLVYSVHPSEAPFIIWPQEQAAARDVANRAAATEEVTSDLQTMIVYSERQPNYAPFAHGVSMGSNLEKRLETDPLLFSGTWIIRSRRQDLMSYQAQDLDPAFWQALDQRLADALDQVYDNGFARVYHRRQP